jgi:Mg-chelatase subunit ChlI
VSGPRKSGKSKIVRALTAILPTLTGVNAIIQEVVEPANAKAQRPARKSDDKGKT